MDAASLCGKKEALQEEQQRLLQQLEKEEAAAAAVAATSGGGSSSSGGKAAGEGTQEDSLDAFMSGVLAMALRLVRTAVLCWWGCYGRRTGDLRMACRHVVPLVGLARLISRAPTDS